MASVAGLLEQHELAARRRVEGQREEADRIQAELGRGRAGMAGVGHRPQAVRYGAGCDEDGIVVLPDAEPAADQDATVREAAAVCPAGAIQVDGNA